MNPVNLPSDSPASTTPAATVPRSPATRDASHATATMEATATNDRMTLTLALSYGSREELVDAFQHVAREAAAGRLRPEDLDAKTVERFLYTTDMPDPDLVIRTSGEQRISNFLLWQISYAELFFTPVLWPDFDRPHLEEALAAYAGRERRKGLTSEQVAPKGA